MIVVDTNVVVKLVFRAVESNVVVRLFEAEPTWLAPRLVRSEILSVLSQHGSKAGLSILQAAEAWTVALEAYEDSTLEAEPDRVLRLAAESGCSSYDCEYVAVAEELGCRLATYDRKVIRRFPSIAFTPEALLAAHR